MQDGLEARILARSSPQDPREAGSVREEAVAAGGLGKSEGNPQDSRVDRRWGGGERGEVSIVHVDDLSIKVLGSLEDSIFQFLPC